MKVTENVRLKTVTCSCTRLETNFYYNFNLGKLSMPWILENFKMSAKCSSKWSFFLNIKDWPFVTLVCSTWDRRWPLFRSARSWGRYRLPPCQRLWPRRIPQRGKGNGYRGYQRYRLQVRRILLEVGSGLCPNRRQPRKWTSHPFDLHRLKSWKIIKLCWRITPLNIKKHYVQ